ncbi:MAG: RluA family pseudouridine synthase [Cytophagaceae bacterium]|jgi:23S rRNA pseudouridine1911/1915/1917 synthase|nr:RluA family pseudouridine synthase [Cytophagaceae bacterium]
MLQKSVETDEFLDEAEGSDEMFEHYRFVADAGQTLLRIDKFLVNRIESVSRSKIQEAADAGNIRVNEISVKPNYRVKPHDVISIVMAYPPHELEIIPQDIPLDVVYEDDALIVINKKAGLVVHPGHGNYSGTMVNALAWYFRGQEWFNSEDPRPGLVHRIDKDTSGLLVVAKTEAAKMHLARQFYDKTSTRNYQAIVWGSFDSGAEAGTITGHIGRSVRDRKQMDVFPDSEQGKPAVTHYRTLERLGYVTFVECRLETGRTHQIRAHFRHIGHPLFNDERYGGNQILKGTTFTKYRQFVENCFALLPRQALHAKTLGFVHPVTEKYIEFDSELPDDMTQVINRWRTYIAGREDD